MFSLCLSSLSLRKTRREGTKVHSHMACRQIVHLDLAAPRVFAGFEKFFLHGTIKHAAYYFKVNYCCIAPGLPTNYLDT